MKGEWKNLNCRKKWNQGFFGCKTIPHDKYNEHMSVYLYTCMYLRDNIKTNWEIQELNLFTYLPISFEKKNNKNWNNQEIK